MAEYLAPKGAAEVVTRRWLVPVADGDSASAIATSASGITVDSATLEGDEAVLVLSGGTAGATGAVTATITTSEGETLVEVLYVPVVAPTATGPTARDIVDFALRKVAGLGETADADQLADGLERLNDMLRLWADTGADVGATFPLEAGTVLYVRDAWQSAIKNNLILQLADIYGAEISPVVAENARRGLQAIKSANLPADRAGAEYY